MSLSLSFPPKPCPHCKHPRKMRSHFDGCPAMNGSLAPTEIVPNLFVGPVEHRGDERFGAVVTILEEREQTMYSRCPEPRGAHCLIVHPDKNPRLLAKCGPAWAFIDRHLGQPSPLLCHCGAGASRSPTLVAGWLMSRLGLSLEAALTLLLVRPPVLHLWYGFLEELLTMEEALAAPLVERGTPGAARRLATALALSPDRASDAVVHLANLYEHRARVEESFDRAERAKPEGQTADWLNLATAHGPGLDALALVLQTGGVAQPKLITALTEDDDAARFVEALLLRITRRADTWAALQHALPSSFQDAGPARPLHKDSLT